MKDYPSNNHKSWAVIGTVLGILAIGIGIFFYQNFFRKTNAKLIETVPADAAFIFEINDNEQFVKTSTSLLPYLNELFAMDALVGFESFIDKFSSKDPKLIISAHENQGKVALLMSTKIDEHLFKNLLKTLQIDPRNHIDFEETQIYSFGTHFKNFKFVYHNSIFSVSEDLELVKKSVVQLKHPRNLLSDKSFKMMYKLVEKNMKQNWLIFNYGRYSEMAADNFISCEEALSRFSQLSEWSAFQIRFSDMELFLSGYTMASSSFFGKFAEQKATSDFPSKIIPLNTGLFVELNTPDYKSFASYYADQQDTNMKKSVRSFLKMAPLGSSLFSLETDSVTYYYLAVKSDTTVTRFADFFPENINSDSLLSHSNNNIFCSNLANCSNMLSFLHRNASLNYFTVIQDYYIFSGTVSALEYYKSCCSKKGYVESNPLYKFANTSLPSASVFKMIFMNGEKNQLNKFLSEKSLFKKSSEGMRVFAVSYDAPFEEVAATNVFLLFR